MDVALIGRIIPVFVQAAWTTVEISLLSLALGLAVAALVAAMRLSHVAALRLAGAAYVSVFRGTPALIQIFTKLEVPQSTAAWGSATQVFDVLEQALDKGPWILGDDFSAADIVIGSGLNFAIRLFKMVPTRPAFDRYLDACAARPAFQRAEKIAAG